jgi:hypothetical protein
LLFGTKTFHFIDLDGRFLNGFLTRFTTGALFFPFATIASTEANVISVIPY